MRKAVVVLLIFLAGCGLWYEGGGPFLGEGYSLDLPKGWMYKRDLMGNAVDVTRDGRLLQNIHATVVDITKHHKDAKKILKKGMLPQEAAEVAIDLMSSDKDLAQFTVLQNDPAKLGGLDGFRLVCSYRLGKVRYKSVYYAALQGEKLYRVGYSAPVRYYFDRDAAVFEDIVKTYKLVEKKQAQETEVLSPR